MKSKKQKIKDLLELLSKHQLNMASPFCRDMIAEEIISLLDANEGDTKCAE